MDLLGSLPNELALIETYPRGDVKKGKNEVFVLSRG